MSNYSESPLVRKIRALRAKAEGKGVTEAEAQAFAAKVQELLAANGLSMADIADTAMAEESVDGHKIPDNRVGSPARKILFRAVCRYYMCEAVGPGRGSTTWTVVGKPQNIMVAMEMFDYLVKTTIRLSNEYGRKNIGSNKIDFRRGCMTRLQERLLEDLHKTAEAKPEWRSPGNPGNLPALFRTERQQVEQFMKHKLNVTWGKPQRVKQGSDAAEGRRAANDISLGRQIGGGGGGRLMIGSK